MSDPTTDSLPASPGRSAMTDAPAAARLLVVDDDEPKRYTIVHTLRRAGYDVREAATGADALRLAGGGSTEPPPDGPPDLVVLDVQLPDFSGLEVCRRLKANPATARIPVLHLSTVYVESGDRTRGLEGGADGYLNQSAEPEEVLATVRALLRVRRAEEAARRAARGWRATFDAIRDGICLLDADGVIRRCNAALAPMLGRTGDELLGRPLSDVLPAAENEEAAGGEPVELRCGERWLRVVVDPIPGESDGVTDGTVCVVSDVTERHAMVAQLRERTDALTEEHLRKDEFLAMLAHELRNPLSPIKNAALLLGGLDGEGSEPEPSARREACEILGRQVDHLSRLVDDLLDVSRIVRGRIELRREPIDLRVCVHTAVEAVRPLIREQNHDLSLTLPDDPVWVNGDAVRLAQILSNLLTNAAKYMVPGGAVRVRAERETDGEGGGTVAVVVEDDGLGIAADVLPHVFVLFAQGETSIERARGGLGIGLTLVKRLATMHGGTVVADSPGPGRGSTFTLRLPTLAAGPADAEPRTTGATAAPAVEPGRSLKVLVVEDSRPAALMMTRLIERFWGHEVRVAADGAAGLAAAAAFGPDLVLCDIGLPGISGYEVAERLRADDATADVLLVALTGYGAVEDRRKSAAAGFDAHLVKPAGVEELKALFTHEKLAPT
ncbi:hybrid sensor histidine kinase/response regulator [Alienimonas californiensis]|uniref:histidine kinase n=1 Tax=Alienimonas californiensis TaxID=2527989 RepID=A0A517P4A1_9PLAN|nr:response regulator [Alienimonas californiensis]QDT14222.1 Virulence sensor protein BvgS precursor [Alienimonas californiensis]